MSIRRMSGTNLAPQHKQSLMKWLSPEGGKKPGESKPAANNNKPMMSGGPKPGGSKLLGNSFTG